jgi:ABC-type phosphate transport system substrate-binding protein
MLSRRCFLLLPAGVAWLPLSCSPDPGGVTLQGSGATFPAPLYKRWFLEFYKRDPRVRINYQPIGSGAGSGARRDEADLRGAAREAHGGVRRRGI